MSSNTSDSTTNEGDNELTQLYVIFFFFFFFLLGIFCRQVGTWLGFKSPHNIPLIVIGMTMGIFFVNRPQYNIPIISELGSIWLHNIYFPLYFFLGAFDLESEFIHIEILPHLAFVCFPTWVVTIVAVSSVGMEYFDFPFGWKEYAVMTMITIVPDLQISKLFMVSKFNFASQRLYILLELECLIGNSLGSVVYLLFMTGHYDTAEDVATFVLKNIFTCLFGFFMGKIATAAIIKMHHDIVNQITAAFTSIFVMYSIAMISSASGDLAVLTMGLVMMNTKASMTPRIVGIISRFIDIVRFAVASSICIIVGILFTVKGWVLFAWDYVTLTVIIYVIMFTTRFAVIFGLWLMCSKLYLKTFHEILTLSSCNLKGGFNIVLIFALLTSDLKLPMENDKLFLLASFQIVFAFFITTPLISFMFTILRKRTFDHEKIIMIQHAIQMINSYKETLVNVLRRMPFTVDADWDVVASSTSIRKSFLRRYEHNKLIMADNKMNDIIIRKDAIKDVLRLQKRLVQEQFVHGTLGGRSVEQFTYHLKKCMHKKMLMSAHDIIKSLAPRQSLQLILRDLAYELNKGRKIGMKTVFVTIVLMVDLYLNVFTMFSKLFLYSNVNDYAVNVSRAFGVIIMIVSLCYVCYTGKLYGHIFAHSLWNWLAWTIYLCSMATIIVDIITTDVEKEKNVLSVLFSRSRVFHKTVYRLFIILSAMLLLIRAMAVACFLYPTQYLLFNFVSAMLNKATFNQCDTCQGFVQISVDALQKVKDRIENTVVCNNIEDVLHQECLAMRQFLGVMESLTPFVMNALKTRIASRLVLMSQEKIISNLDHSGLLDEDEVLILTTVIRDKLKTLYNFRPTVDQPLMVDVVKNVPWIITSKINYRDAIGKGELKILHAGDVLLPQGTQPAGIFIMLQGLVRAENVMITHHISQENTDIRSKYFIQQGPPQKTDELTDFYSRGNVIGEFPFLTGRLAHKTYRCVTAVKVLVIPKESMYDLMGGRPQWGCPMNHIEYCMWTSIAIRQGARLVQRSATYHLLTRRHIYRLMEDAYVIDGLKDNRVILEGLQKAAVILLYGEMYCSSTGHFYRGPCILPSSVVSLEVFGPENANTTRIEPIRDVILVIRSYNTISLGKGRTPLKESDLEDVVSGDDYTDPMTVSSGSSDGVPYARYKSEVYTKDEAKNTTPEKRKRRLLL